MKTQTDIEINLCQFQAYQTLSIDPNGFVLKFFMSCSEVDSKPFKIRDQKMQLNQKLSIKNIVGEQLEVWLCDSRNKMIAISSIQITKEGQIPIQSQLKLNSILFARFQAKLNVSKTQIEKIVYVQPDEELLKREEDPEQTLRKQQQQDRKQREQAELDKLAKQQKKHAITRTHKNKKDQPFL